MSESRPIGHVVDPYVVGGSIIALKCKEGVVLATDTLLSYGGLLSMPPFMQSTPMSAGSRKLLTPS